MDVMKIRIVDVQFHVGFHCYDGFLLCLIDMLIICPPRIVIHAISPSAQIKFKTPPGFPPAQEHGLLPLPPPTDRVPGENDTTGL